MAVAPGPLRQLVSHIWTTRKRAERILARWIHRTVWNGRFWESGNILKPSWKSTTSFKTVSTLPRFQWLIFLRASYLARNSLHNEKGWGNVQSFVHQEEHCWASTWGHTWFGVEGWARLSFLIMNSQHDGIISTPVLLYDMKCFLNDRWLYSYFSPNWLIKSTKSIIPQTCVYEEVELLSKNLLNLSLYVFKKLFT